MFLPREDPAALGPLALLQRLAVGIVSLAVILALLAFAWVILLVLGVVFMVLAVWVRYRAAKAGLPWRLWLMRTGMARGNGGPVGRAGGAAAFDAGLGADSPDLGNAIEGEFAVLQEARLPDDDFSR